MLKSTICGVMLACALGLAGCGDQFKRSGGLQGAIDAGVQEESNAKARRYEDAEAAFERPARWTVTPVEAKDENVYVLNIANPENLFARLTLVRESPDPGGFPFEVVQELRRANPSVASEPFTTPFAGHDARGYKYRMKSDGLEWEGWVVSFAHGRSEACFLGQFPADAPATLRAELTTFMNSIQVKRFLKKGGESKP